LNIRIEAVNYALAMMMLKLKDISLKLIIILVGVSRSGKTPTSLYLALQYGIKEQLSILQKDDMGDILKLHRH